MNKHRIVLIADIQLVDPNGGKPIPGPRFKLSFEMFMNLLFTNPDWSSDWQHGLAQHAIRQSFAAMKEKSETFFDVEDPHWELLVKAAKNPVSVRETVQGTQMIPGFGYDASLASQIVPMQLAIIKAEAV